MESKSIRLGFFMILGTIFLTVALYLIGTRQGLFQPTITLIANFKDVNGLQPGNNVRYSGINVGTVKNITIATDSTIEVKMIIDKSIQPFIKRSYLVSIGTDGLMGNKLINIQPVAFKDRTIVNHDTLQTLPAIDTYEMLRTLNLTNENVNLISYNLKNITEQLSHTKGPAWKLLNDPSLSVMLDRSMRNLQASTEKANQIIAAISETVGEVKGSSGIYSILKDSVTKNDIQFFLANLKNFSDKSLTLTDSIRLLVNDIRYGKGSAAAVVTDTAMANNLRSAILTLKSGSEGFQDNMNALKQSFLLKGYFKKKEKMQPALK